MDTTTPVESPTIPRCPADGPVGVLVSIVGLLAAATTLLAGGMLLAVVSPVFGRGGVGWNRFSSSTGEESFPWVPTFIIGSAFLMCLLAFVSGIGIARGRQRGFSFAIVCFGLFALFGSGASVLGIAVVLYCIMRKMGIGWPRVS
jgi:hypothetical protein